MPRFGRRRSTGRPVPPARAAAWCVTLAAVVVVGLGAAAHARQAERLAYRLAAAAKSLPRRAATVPPAPRHGQFYRGTPAVGALFTVTGSRLGQHFCTASVLASPVKDLVITAAHCLHGHQVGRVAFVPGYHRGQRPYGAWRVTRIFAGSAWKSRGSTDDDVAILVVHQAGNPDQVQTLTGGEALGTGWKAMQPVQVIGYPDGRERPITCPGRTRAFGPHQLEFDCGGYTKGTSGGPFLAKVRPATGRGTVIGVIGGYQQGGDTPSVSYSARFAQQVRALYNQAVAGN